MNKNPRLIFVALVFAAITFACGRGAQAATSVPQQESTQAIKLPTEQPRSNEQKVEIKSSSSYVDGFNDYNVSGEVVNNTDDPIENVTLSVSITDEGGATLLKDDNENPVDSVEIQPDLAVLMPGASAPFNYYISADDVKPAKYEVSIKSFDKSHAPDPVHISIENVQSNETAGGDIVITGELINESSDQVDVESLAGSLLDDANTVLAANSTLTYARYLAPSDDVDGRDRGPFIIRLFGPVEDATQWKVYGRAIENSNTPPAEVAIELANSYMDAYGNYHLLGTLKNNGSSQISPAVIAGLYSPDKTVFDAASLNIPMYLNTFSVIDPLPADQASPADKIIQPDLYWTFSTNYDVVALETKYVKVSQDGSNWKVSGTVVNTSDRKLGSISVVVQFADDSQTSATNSTAIYPPEGSDTIDPGTSNEFSVPLSVPENWDLGSQDYQVIVQGVVYQ